MEKESRPEISTIKTSKELKRWYWLKDELMAHTRYLGIKSSGAKFTILERLAHYLDTGDKNWKSDIKTRQSSSFDWHKEPLSLSTVITDSYKNSQNVRRFFKQHIGEHFKFTIAFMDWMKSNYGRTLSEAVQEYHRLQEENNDSSIKTKIKSHNQFNQYIRDFLADNPTLGINDARRVWALKRALPSKDGKHSYAKSDLNL